MEKSLVGARQNLFWVGQSKDVKQFVEKCSICQRTQKSKTKEPLLQKVLQLVSTDLFQFKGKDFILIADHYSGFFDFHVLKSTSSREVILCFKKWFAVHGIPETLESDGGPQYTSKEFKDFATRWQFNHKISSPYYARSNGFAERNVQTAKNLLRKCWYDDSDIFEALLMLRNTPRNQILGSHSQRLFSRNTRTFIPIDQEELKPKIINGVTRELARLRFEQKKYADKVSSPFKQLEINEKVRLQKGHRDWASATVVEKTPNPRSVIVETSSGKRYRRNTIHLQRTSADISDVPEFEITNNSSNSQQSTLPPVQPTIPANDNDDLNQAVQSPIKRKPGRPPGKSTKSQPAINLQDVQMTRSGRIIKPPKRYH